MQAEQVDGGVDHRRVDGDADRADRDETGEFGASIAQPALLEDEADRERIGHAGAREERGRRGRQGAPVKVMHEDSEDRHVHAQRDRGRRRVPERLAQHELHAGAASSRTRRQSYRYQSR